MMLTHSEARKIARSLWGHVNGSEKTNKPGTFWFDCSGHGGYIVSADAIDAPTRAKIDEFVKPDTAIRYAWDNKTRLYNPYSQRGVRIGHSATSVKIQFYVFEEDCNWAVATLFWGLFLKKDMATKERFDEVDTAARKTFYDWFCPSNPAVIRRKEIQELQDSGDNDLVRAAWLIDQDLDIVRVVTYADKEYEVTGYKDCRCEYGYPWLSKCKTITEVS